jgi:hypothetical protein
MGRITKYGGIFLVLAALLVSSCSSSKDYRARYRKAWRKVVNSQAWLDALAANNSDATSGTPVYYSVPTAREQEIIENLDDLGLEIDHTFLEKYPSLVSRAYYRIIAEAETADKRIAGDYQYLSSELHKPGNEDNRQLKRQLELSKKRFEAHREMLEGLKSWRSFNQYGSDDLDFFLEDYLPEAHEMYVRGADDEHIIAFLMGKLADLYHFEERGRED